MNTYKSIEQKKNTKQNSFDDWKKLCAFFYKWRKLVELMISCLRPLHSHCKYLVIQMVYLLKIQMVHISIYSPSKCWWQKHNQTINKMSLDREEMIDRTTYKSSSCSFFRLSSSSITYALVMVSSQWTNVIFFKYHTPLIASFIERYAFFSSKKILSILLLIFLLKI